jgi:alpha-L-rhamnosidase
MNKFAFARLIATWVFFVISCKAFSQEKVYQKGLLAIKETPLAERKYAPTGTFYDFGKTFFGRLKLVTTSMKNGDMIKVFMGEKLDAAGKIDRNPPGVNIRFFQFTYIKNQGDTDTLYFPNVPNKKNTSGNAILLPEWMGLVTPFRYVEIEHEGKFTVFPTREIFHYRFNENAASFVSSDTVLNQIWELCKHSIKATTVTGLYIDGDRERIPYEADALINQLSHYAVDSVYEVARNTIDHLMMHPTWPTEWHLQMHQVIWNDYMYTGNTSLIKEYYDLLKTKTLMSLAKKGNLITTVGSKQNKSLLDSLHYVTFDQKPVLRDITDWPQRGNNLAGPDYKGEADEFVFCEYNSIVNAYHYKSLILMEQFAILLQKKADQVFFKQRAAQVKQSFSDMFFDKNTGLVRDGDTTHHASFHANFFALDFGLLDQTQKAKVIPFVIKKEMACSVYGSQFLMDALYENGLEKEALALLQSRKDRGWYHMIEVGAGMTMEAWDSKFKPNLDWNHAWGAAPANIIAFRLMGLRPSKPGFKEILIDPQPGDLQSATYVLPTPLGPVKETISTINGKRSVEVILPAGMAYKLAPKDFPITVKRAKG